MAKDLPGTHYHPVAGWLRPSEGERISSNTKPLSPNRWMFGSTKHRQESLRMAGTPWMFYLSPWEKLSNMSMVLTGPHLGKTLLFNVANPHRNKNHFSRFSTKIARRIGLCSPRKPARPHSHLHFAIEILLWDLSNHDFMVPMGLSQKIGTPKPRGFLNFFLGK